MSGRQSDESEKVLTEQDLPNSHEKREEMEATQGSSKENGSERRKLLQESFTRTGWRENKLDTSEQNRPENDMEPED